MNEKITKVCCFCEKWESGGIESFLFNVITHMDLQSLEIHIVASCLTDSVFTERLQKLGVIFHQLSGSQRNVLTNWRMFWILLNEQKFDVVHLNIFHGLSLRYMDLAQKAGVPVRIAHSHNTALRKSTTQRIKLLIHEIGKRLWAKRATNFWACSKAAAEFMFPSRFMQEYRFIPNGIDVERFRFSLAGRSEMRCMLGLKDELLIGNVGRLCEQKNQRFLLDVFAEVVKVRQDAYLLLVGEGELRSELEKQAAKLGILERVIFYGLSEHVERLMWAMDVFAFPSLFEGLGIVAIEAQAAGLPVVCSEFVPEEVCFTEFVYQYSLDEKAWANKVIELLTEDERVHWSKQVETAGFEINNVANRIQNVYMMESERYK